jgi:hypothetical protein
MTVLIVLSIGNALIASYPRDFCQMENAYTPAAVRTCAGTRLEETEPVHKQIEAACVIVFTIEYALRLATCGDEMPLLSFLFDPLNMLDVLSILPFYVELVITAVTPTDEQKGTMATAFTALRVLRVFRILRALKVTHTPRTPHTATAEPLWTVCGTHTPSTHSAYPPHS